VVGHRHGHARGSGSSPCLWIDPPDITGEGLELGSEWVAILALIALFVVGTVLPINMGALAYVAAWLVGVYSLHLSEKEILGGVSADLILTLIDVTYLFGPNVRPSRRGVWDSPRCGASWRAASGFRGCGVSAPSAAWCIGFTGPSCLGSTVSRRHGARCLTVALQALGWATTVSISCSAGWQAVAPHLFAWRRSTRATRSAEATDILGDACVGWCCGGGRLPGRACAVRRCGSSRHSR
jgi:hypothetical protein